MASAPASEYIDPFAPVVLRLPNPSSSSSSKTDSSSSQPNSLELHVLPYGLTMHRLLVHHPSTAQPAEELIVGPESPRDHHTYGRHFFGPIVGRFANRLPSGKSDFSYDDGGVETGQVDLPEWGGEGICHHGGPTPAGEGQDGGEEEVVRVKRGEVKPQEGPFDRVVWTGVEDEKKVELFDKASSSSSSTVIFALHSIGSPAGQQGFEGDVRVEVRVELVAGKDAPKEARASSSSMGSVRVEYRAKLLTPEIPVTPFNLTHHWGFNLTASNPSSASSSSRIDDHLLHLLRPNTGRLACDARGVATGEVLPLDEAHSWASGQGKRIAESMPEGGYDDFYLWPHQDDEDLPAVALLSSPSSPNGKEAPLSLLFRTDQSGVQLYTANGQPASPAPTEEAGGAMKVVHRHAEGGEQEQGNAARSAAFLEFGEPHACFLRPGLQEYVRGGRKEGKDVGLLRRGETYANRVEVEVLRG